MTNEMQDYRPVDPPPPPPAEPVGGYYSPWSADPTWGPPTWPPTQQRQGQLRVSPDRARRLCDCMRRRRRWHCVGTHHDVGLRPVQRRRRTPGSNRHRAKPRHRQHHSVHRRHLGGDRRADRLGVVDITADEAGGNGEVAGTGMIITLERAEVLTNNHVIDDTVNIHAQIDGTGTIYTVKVIGYDAKRRRRARAARRAHPAFRRSRSATRRRSAGDGITVLGNADGKGGTPAEVSGTVSDLGAADHRER